MGKLLNKNIKHLCDDKDGFMSLYAVGDPKDLGTKPIIFIRGHAGRYTINTKKVLDSAQPDDKLIKAHDGFYYDEKIHFPIIGEFSYKDNIERRIKTYNSELISTQKFADSIMEMLEKMNLSNVDMVGSSVGANICMLCSLSDRIDRVSVVSPTMPYAYLADINLLNSLKYKSLLNWIMYQIAQIYLDHGYAFVDDMNLAFRDPDVLKKLIAVEKIFIEAGDVHGPESQNIRKWFLELCISISAEVVRKNTGLLSDGAVVVDPEFYNKLGVKYRISNDNYHIWCDQAEKILTRAYNNLNLIK